MIPTALTGEYLTKDSADTLYYPLNTNPSGYLTAHQSLEDYQTTAGMTAYLTTGDSSNFYPMTGNPSGFLTEHQSLTAYLTKNSADTLYQPTGNYLTAVPANYATSGDVTGTAQWALTTAGWEKITAAEGDYELSAGDGISIVDYPEDQKTVISVTGGGTEYSAGQYIDIDSADVISVTGLQPAGSYQTAGRYVKYDTNGAYFEPFFTAEPMGKQVSGHMTVNDDMVPEIAVSGTIGYNKSAYMKITTAGVEVYSGGGYGVPEYHETYGKYTAGPNIAINASNGISGKDWTNTITAASAYAASMATGKEYTGVAPIVVNNSEDKISANTMELIAGNGIEFVTAATSTTINCTAAGGGASTHYYIDTPNDHTSADIELTIQITANQGGRYDRWLMNSGNFIGALIPSADTIDDAGKVLTVTAGSPRWQSLPSTPSGALGIKVLAVATSAAATAGDADTLYIVTGS